MENIKVGDRVYVPEDATFTDIFGGRQRVADAIQDKEVIVKEKTGYVPTNFLVNGGYLVDRDSITLVASTEPDYTFDPGGEVIKVEDVKVGDTIAVLYTGTWSVSKVTDVHDSAGSSSYGWSADVFNSNDDIIADKWSEEIRLLNRPIKAERIEALVEVLGSIQYPLFVEAVDTKGRERLALELSKKGVVVSDEV